MQTKRALIFTKSLSVERPLHSVLTTSDNGRSERNPHSESVFRQKHTINLKNSCYIST